MVFLKHEEYIYYIKHIFRKLENKIILVETKLSLAYFKIIIYNVAQTEKSLFFKQYERLLILNDNFSCIQITEILLVISIKMLFEYPI